MPQIYKNKEIWSITRSKKQLQTAIQGIIGVIDQSSRQSTEKVAEMKGMVTTTIEIGTDQGENICRKLSIRGDQGQIKECHVEN